MFLFFLAGLQHRRQGHGLYGPRGHQHQQQGHPARGRPAGGGGNRPFFEPVPFDEESGEGGRNVTTVEGGRAVLACVVRNLGENMTVGDKGTIRQRAPLY